MRSHPRHVHATLVAVLALAGAAAAGAVLPGGGRACPARQQPTFRAGVELVAIDVNVVGKQAQPIEDLRPADFEVTVDRRPRRIVSAQYINHGVRLAGGSPAKIPSAGLPESLAAPAAAPSARNVMIVVDSDSLDLTTGRAATLAARTFLDALPAVDRVSVATIPRVPSSIRFTSDRAIARRDLDAVITEQPELPTGDQTVGLQEAFDIERSNTSVVSAVVSRECKCGYPPESFTSETGQQACTGVQIEICVVPLMMLARQTALAAHMQAQRSLDALRDLAQGLAQVPGPKTVVLVSGGLGVPETSTAFDPLEPALANGQVTLYTLYIEQPSLGQARKPLSPSFAFDDRIPLYGIENVTAAAGGTLVHVVGRIESAFGKVATEMSGSYLLGIEVDAGDRDGKPHDVQVKVKRAGVEVRSRRRYFIEPEKSAPASAADTGHAAPLSAAARAARRAEREAPRVPELEAVTPELVALLVRAGEFVADYQPRIAALVCDEQYDQTLSKWRSGPVAVNGVTQNKEDWFVDKRRHMRSEYVLVKGDGPIGWTHFRDALDVDGAVVNQRGGRLAALFADAPAKAVEQAARIMSESARYNLGFGQRNMDVPTLALVLLEPGIRGRFFFRKEADVVLDGIPTWQIAYTERARPTIFAPDANTNLPLEGTFWIEPRQGRVIRSTLRLNMEQTDAEITATYRPAPEVGGLWVPADVSETYTSDTQKLECRARCSNFRVLKK